MSKRRSSGVEPPCDLVGELEVAAAEARWRLAALPVAGSGVAALRSRADLLVTRIATTAAASFSNWLPAAKAAATAGVRVLGGAEIAQVAATAAQQLASLAGSLEAAAAEGASRRTSSATTPLPPPIAAEAALFNVFAYTFLHMQAPSCVV